MQAKNKREEFLIFIMSLLIVIVIATIFALFTVKFR